MAIHHVHARRPIDGESIDSMPLAVEDLRRGLRRRADQTIANALGIQVNLLAGYNKVETQDRLGLNGAEYSEASRWLRDESGRLRAAGG